MSNLHFAPNSAIRYIGKKSKEFVHSLARPKPIVKPDDIIIVSKKTANTLVTRGFGDFEYVTEIELTDNKTLAEFDDCKKLHDELVREIEASNTKNAEFTKELKACNTKNADVEKELETSKTKNAEFTKELKACKTKNAGCVKQLEALKKSSKKED